jgi:hypothetical protein
MNPPKVTGEDDINFIIATPRDVNAAEVRAKTLRRTCKKSNKPLEHSLICRKGKHNKSVDVRAKQRLCYQRVFLP